MAGPIKLGFTLLDIALMTTAIIMPPPAGLGVDWPIQTRLRTRNSSTCCCCWARRR